METITLIVAGGGSTRMENETPKPYLTLGTKTILELAISQFQQNRLIDGVLVVYNQEHQQFYDTATAGLQLLPAVIGGKTRQESVFLGLQALKPYQPKNVLIHDAARPFVDQAIINKVINALAQHSAVIPAVKITDSLKTCMEDKVIGSIDRNHIYSAQTPQAFVFDEILAAHTELQTHNFSDDAGLFEYLQKKIHITQGSTDNFKITTEKDYALGKLIMEANMSNSKKAVNIKVGMGFDAHKFGPAEANQNFVTLCGVEVAFDKSLQGHSDADVAIHAICDALFGAVADGDIGAHFPPSDPQYKGAKSEIFLKYAVELVKKYNGNINNIDVTIICEKPKIGPYREQMRAKLAEITGIDIADISVKATTTEKMGFTGREEGIAAQAVACVGF